MRISDWSSDVCSSDLGFAPGRTDSAAPPQHLISPEAGDALRIVLVDDDDDFREAIGAELEDLGFRVTGLPDGPSMLDYFAAGNSSDVVVLDWRLDRKSPRLNSSH